MIKITHPIYLLYIDYVIYLIGNEWSVSSNNLAIVSEMNDFP